MAAGSKRRWLVLAVLAGAGAWFVRSRMAGPRGLTGPVRVLPADPTPAGPTPTTAVTPGEPGAAWDATAPSTGGASWSVTPAAPAPTPPVVPPQPPETTAVPTAPTAPAAPTPAEAEPEPESEVAAPEVAVAPSAPAPEPAPRPRPSPVPRASKPSTPKPATPKPATPKAETPKVQSPELPDRTPLPSGQALFAPPAAEATSGAAPLPDGSAPGTEYTIKGNADSMLFHTPDSPYYKRTKAEVWFRDADEARAAGFIEWAPRKRATQ